MPYRNRTRYQGVYERESTERSFNGRPDVCYDICYKKDKKLIWEKIGWVSEGYSPKIAFQLRSDRLRTIRHGEDLPREKRQIPYFKDVAKKFLEWSQHNRRSYVQDDNRYRLHLQNRFDSKRMDEISSFDLEKMKADLSKSDYSPQTIKHCLRLVGTIFNKAVAWGMYDGKNPLSQVKIPSVRNERLKYLSFEEAHTLLNHLSGNKRTKKLHDMVLLSLFTGCRAGELFNLKGRDLNFETGLIAFIDTKNGTTRYVPMTDDIRSMLQRRMPENLNDFVFKSVKGERIKEISRSFDRAIRALKFNSGVEDPRMKVTFHTLRHSFISWNVLNGVPLRTVQELSGHKSLSMLQRYSHLAENHKKQAASILERSFHESSRHEEEKGLSSEEMKKA